MGDLDGKLVLVTGAARGIGAGIVQHLAGQGATVVPVDLKASGDEPPGLVEIDITDAAAVGRLVRDVRARHGHVHALVNNAGVSRRADLGDLDEDTWRTVIDTNLWGGVRLVRELRPLMGPGSSVVNVTSIRASVAFAGDTAYIASKGGLQAATRALAVELGPAGIRVNAVAPGAVETDLNREVLNDPAHRDRVLGRIPLGRLGTPADVAGAVAFLVGDQSGWVTGSVLTVDGGQTALG